MKISKNEEVIYPIGILWNMGNKFAREIVLKININQDVIQVREYDLKDRYDEFVLDCYRGDNEAYQDGYIYEKIKNMKATNNTKVIAFVVQIDEPTYVINQTNGNKQCMEARKIKQQIRGEYASKIEGYFFDNLIHISDNEEETQRVQSVLEKYEDYLKEDYVRKGYQPIIKRINSKEDKSYISLLKDEEER